ncbi:saccharopine dehydrogenase [Streptomyces tateyamensis]|uniref:Saccharopine dehydrogenase n=1 Tax=Streptomyces tateyamensis TaxID=565073 RepID=A0A2V4N2Q9_9ACTN|nr:saccharopine dehydrogenase family protein [Streptomyces tateyamensis]PYC71895.1 saccharopine dehydrogenase [Streptomyces tateyamensis]
MSDRTESDRTEGVRTVHWIGTGLSTGRSGLELLLDHGARLVLWGRTAEKAEQCLAERGLAGRAAARALDEQALAAELAPGDVLVSMLPAAHHTALLRLALECGAHFACSSYVSPELAELAATAKQSVVLTEAGLDPGIDHLMAHRLVELGRAAAGDAVATADFTSYCGGLPAEPNEFRYRFSWAPLGVLNALRSPARYLRDWQLHTATRPWQATTDYPVGAERFEVYPNRDSLPFAEQYGFPYHWRKRSFVRGTLRPAGWRAAWAEVFATVETGDDERIAALAAELAQRHPMREQDRDRVVLAVALDLDWVEGAWSGSCLLDLYGDERESAMARLVSLPLAFGITRILDGALAPGLNRAAESAQEAERWLDFLAGRGLTTELRTTERTAQGAPR